MKSLLEKTRSRNGSAQPRPPVVGIANTAACSGVSLVEMLVTVLLVMIAAVGLSTAISAALSHEQQYREESAVRTALALQMEYAERYLSLASDITTTGGVSTVEFRPEGGVSLETGHWIRVTGVTTLEVNDALTFVIASGDDRKDAVSTNVFRADGLLRTALATNTLARLEGSGAVRKLTLAASYAVRTRDGVEVRAITNTRPVRMWNKD